MNIRQADQDDAESIALLHATSWRRAYRGMLRDEYLDGDVIPDRISVWENRLNAPKNNQLTLLAENEGEIIGFVCAFGNEDSRWGTFIDNLHVRYENKRQGIGRRLMQEVARWSLKQYPDAGLYLGVLEKNYPARQFYESLGAKNQETTQWEPPGGGLVNNLLYVWSSLETTLLR